MRTLRNLATVGAIGVAAIVIPSTVALAKGPSGSSGGTSAGTIVPVSVPASCDAGSTIQVSLSTRTDKKSKRTEVYLDLVTIAGGMWEVRLDNTTNGTVITDFGAWMPEAAFGWSATGNSVPKGTSQLAFVAIRREGDTPPPVGAPPAAIVETCSVGIAVEAN